MRDLIYLPLPFLLEIDPSLKDTDYPHRKWFLLNDSIAWCTHTTSRAHKLDTPWSLANTMLPIPEITEQLHDITPVMDGVAAELESRMKDTGKPVYLFWSGGIDSTAILVSLLRVWSQDSLKQLTVLLDNRSCIENSYFYHKFIKSSLNVGDANKFEVTTENYNKIIVVDGEGGNQIMHGPSTQRQTYRGRFDLLDAKWKDIPDLTKLLVGSNDFNIELITRSIKHAPVPINTGYDFLWWVGFNFKFDDVFIRRMFSYAKHLNPEQSAEVWNNSYYKFYAHPKIQMWAMTTSDMRRQSLKINVKYFAKKYIYDFDNNDFYWNSKTEQASMLNKFLSYMPLGNDWFAVDQAWNKYRISDPAVRKELGKILQRI